MAWRCIRIDDNGRDGAICEICHRKVRHVHVLMRPDIPEPVRVGCRCAGKLEGNSQKARRRESAYSSLALKLEIFMNDRSWRRSASGERFDAKSWNVQVDYAPQGWVATILHQDVCFSERLGPFADVTALRRSAFVRLMELVGDERIADYPLREPELEFAA